MMSKGTFMKDEELIKRNKVRGCGIQMDQIHCSCHKHVVHKHCIFLNVFSYATGHIEGKTSAWLEFTLKSQPKL